MPAPDGGPDTMTGLIEEFLARTRAGQQPTADEFAARAPELADCVRFLFPALASHPAAAAPHEPATADALLELLYADLRQTAARLLAREREPNTLCPTSLVHEAYLRVAADPGRAWAGRRQFFAVAAETMRRLLVERARRRKRLRHGGASPGSNCTRPPPRSGRRPTRCSRSTRRWPGWRPRRRPKPIWSSSGTSRA